MTKVEKQNFTNRETETRKLAYDVDFRAWMKEHPGVLKTFLEIVRSEEFKKAKKGDVVEKDQVKVTIREELYEGPHIDRGPRLKVEIDGAQFFVKIEKDTDPLLVKGHKEFTSAQKAKELLKDMRGVEVYESQLGYQTEKESFFVSKWIDLPSLFDYKYKLQSSKKLRKSSNFEDLRTREFRIHSALNNFFDVYDTNMFYDEKTDTIILFDINEAPNLEN